MYYMDAISFRPGKRFERIINSDLKEFSYSTRTEYIRQAIRELHQKLSAEKAIAQLAKNRGLAKRLGYKEPTEEEYERAREEAARELFAELKVKSLRAKQRK